MSAVGINMNNCHYCENKRKNSKCICIIEKYLDDEKQTTTGDCHINYFLRNVGEFLDLVDNGKMGHTLRTQAGICKIIIHNALNPVISLSETAKLFYTLYNWFNYHLRKYKLEEIHNLLPEIQENVLNQLENDEFIISFDDETVTYRGIF